MKHEGKVALCLITEGICYPRPQYLLPCIHQAKFLSEKYNSLLFCGSHLWSTNSPTENSSNPFICIHKPNWGTISKISCNSHTKHPQITHFHIIRTMTTTRTIQPKCTQCLAVNNGALCTIKPNYNDICYAIPRL
jgi:hypothetical protein